MTATNSNRLQIEQAAHGCISSRLCDWPALVAALEAERIVLPMDTPMSTVTQICRLLNYYFISVDSANLVELTPDEKEAFKQVECDFLSELKTFTEHVQRQHGIVRR